MFKRGVFSCCNELYSGGYCGDIGWGVPTHENERIICHFLVCLLVFSLVFVFSFSSRIHFLVSFLYAKGLWKEEQNGAEWKGKREEFRCCFESGNYF